MPRRRNILCIFALVMAVIGRLFDLGRSNAAFALATLLPVAGYVLWRILHGGTEPRHGQRKTLENNVTSKVVEGQL